MSEAQDVLRLGEFLLILSVSLGFLYTLILLYSIKELLKAILDTLRRR